MHQQDLAREACRRHGFLDEVEDDVVELRFLGAREAVDDVELVAELDHGVVAARGRCSLADVALGRVGAITQHVIPEDLHALLRDRERNADHGSGHAVAAGREIGSCRNALGRIIDALRVRGRAMARVHIHEVRVLVRLEKRLVSFGEIRGVLSGVLCVDFEKRLFVRKRIGMMLARRVTRHAGFFRGDETAIPRGDRARGVARLLAAKRREIGAEPGRLLRADRCLGLRPRMRTARERPPSKPVLLSAWSVPSWSARALSE